MGLLEQPVYTGDLLVKQVSCARLLVGYYPWFIMKKPSFGQFITVEPTVTDNYMINNMTVDGFWLQRERGRFFSI